RPAQNPDGPRAELRPGALRRHGGDRHRRPARAAGAAMTLDPKVGAIVLQLVLWLPLVGAVVVAIAGAGHQEPHPGPVEGAGHASTQETAHPPATSTLNLQPWRIATAFALITFLLAAWLFVGFDRSSASQYQFVVNIPWLPFGSNYWIGVDGLSMPLVVLNALLSLSAIAGSWRVPRRQPVYFSPFLVVRSARAG